MTPITSNAWEFWHASVVTTVKGWNTAWIVQIDEKQAPLPVYLIFFTYIDTRWRTIVKTGFVYYFYPASMSYG